MTTFVTCTCRLTAEGVRVIAHVHYDIHDLSNVPPIVVVDHQPSDQLVSILTGVGSPGAHSWRPPTFATHRSHLPPDSIQSCVHTHTGLNIFTGPSGFSIARVEEGNSVGNSRGIRGNSMVVSGNSMDLLSAWSYKS